MQTTRRRLLEASATFFAASILDPRLLAADTLTADVCVYGATAGGIAAALGAADAGASVVMVEPSRWLGGMSGGGLSAIDWGYKPSVSRIALKLLIENDDVAMRALYGRELQQRGIGVIGDHRIAPVSKDGARILAITLDNAPPDRFGCPVKKARTTTAKTVRARDDVYSHGACLDHAGTFRRHRSRAQPGRKNSRSGHRFFPLPPRPAPPGTDP
jgi:hypothetical protein